MKVSDALLDICKQNGLQGMAAIKAVSSYLKELRERPPGTYSLCIGATRITIRKD